MQSRPRSIARQIGRASFWSLSIFIILLFLSMLTAGPGLFELPFVLATGWMRFLARTVPKVTWNWDLVGMGIISAAVILLLAHWFLSWIVKNVASARGVEWRWPWKWTWCGLLATALLFLVGMAVGGTTHQVGWIASSQEPWYEAKRGKVLDISNMKQLDLAIRLALEDADGDIENARRGLWKSGNGYFSQSKSSPPMMQTYHLLVVTGEDGQAMGTIIFPRDAQKRAAVGGYYNFNEKDGGLISQSKLQELIQKHRAKLTAF
jgi:hypothetical protein